MSSTSVREGYAAFQEWRTWYRVTGSLDTDMTPLVILHGGPGCSHDYLLALEALADTGRPVIHYDQLGGGRSTLLADRGADFWTVDLFLAELDNLLRALGISDEYHLLGQSWGGMLGAEHAISRPSGLRGLVLSNAPASMDLWVDESKKLRAQLPRETRDVLDAHEAAGTIYDESYLAASQVYYDEHVCRVVPNPPEVLKTIEYMAADPTVYNTMFGPNEFFCVGSLRPWSVIDRLSRITSPTLLLSGRFDEATPATIQPFFDNVAGARWEIFEHSSHMPFVEETERYLDVVNGFLADVDAR
jgi:L-proline amide hydrolase